MNSAPRRSWKRADNALGAAGNALHRANEQAEGTFGSRLSWLRAGVLGANDGIVSTAGVVVGVAGATSDRTQILKAGIAAIVAGELSMAGGECISVSAQRDAEAAAIAKERLETQTMLQEELHEPADYMSAEAFRPRPRENSLKSQLLPRMCFGATLKRNSVSYRVSSPNAGARRSHRSSRSRSEPSFRWWQSRRGRTRFGSGYASWQSALRFYQRGT